MMVRVVNLHELPLAPGVTATFMRERGAAHDSYHRVHLPSEGLAGMSANHAVWLAASRVMPYLVNMDEGPDTHYILVHVTNRP